VTLRDTGYDVGIVFSDSSLKVRILVLFSDIH
jgi:hypothetical protein